MDRRNFLEYLICMTTLSVMKNDLLAAPATEEHPLLKFIRPFDQWDGNQLDDFLYNVYELDYKNLILNSLRIPIAQYDAQEVKKYLVKASSNAMMYPLKNKGDINYHEIVEWAANKMDVPSIEIKGSSTFRIERLIMERLFIRIWDKLELAQRQELLKRVDSGKEVNIAAISTLSGAAALAALSTTVYFTGFAFYTTMSTMIFTVAGFFGVTIPFAGYMGASSAVATLSGPVGWTLIGIGLVAAGIMLGAADVDKTVAFIIQLHLIKVDLLNKAGKLEEINAALAIK